MCVRVCVYTTHTPTSKPIPRNENVCLQKDILENVHSSFLKITITN